jgi:F-type H+-transporting ATPase subunit gamma
MANLKAIKTRIVSVKSTQKITKAMKMVAAAKLKRAQDNLTKARPYSNHLRVVISEIAKRAEKEDSKFLSASDDASNDVLFLVISGDRGLCGGFNSNITRDVKKFIIEQDGNFDKCDLTFIGKKSYESFKGKNEYSIANFYKEFMDDLSFEKAKIISDDLIDLFVSGKYKEVYMIYNEFKSAIAQEVILEKVLPIEAVESDEEINIPYIYEPSKIELLDRLLNQYLTTEIYRALLESYASEQGARMNAMESATSNADEMISSLTLTYNRARQAAITTELVEVISGAAAASE